jgi:hypothetical protein
MIGQFDRDIFWQTTDQWHYCSLGQAPYNVNAKYAPLYLQYPTTTDYECDMDAACCEVCEGGTMIAVVNKATG